MRTDKVYALLVPFSSTGGRDICYSCSSVSSSGLIELAHRLFEPRLRFSYGFRDLQPRKIESPTEGYSHQSEDDRGTDRR